MRSLVLLLVGVLCTTAAVPPYDAVHNDYPPQFNEKHFVDDTSYDGPSKPASVADKRDSSYAGGFGKDEVYGNDFYGKGGYGKDSYNKQDYVKTDYGYPNEDAYVSNKDGYNPKDNDYRKDSYPKDNYGKDPYPKKNYIDEPYPKDNYMPSDYPKDNYHEHDKDSFEKITYGKYSAKKDYVGEPYGKLSEESYADSSASYVDNSYSDNKDPYPEDNFGKKPWTNDYAGPKPSDQYRSRYPAAPPYYRYPTYSPVYPGFPYNYFGFPYNYQHGYPFGYYPRVPQPAYFRAPSGIRDSKYICKNSGYYYRDDSSFYHCYDDDYTVQHCAPGSMNHPGAYYERDTEKNSEKDFCGINMATFGYPPAAPPYIPPAAPVYPPTFAPTAPVYPPPAPSYADEKRKIDKH